MVEWSITTVLKTVVPRGTGGSNPSLSANKGVNQQVMRFTPFITPKKFLCISCMVFSVSRKNLILAIQSAGVSRGRNGFRKDKSGEKLAEAEEALLEHRTDGSDAFDTLYIGCEKFPVHDIMNVPVSSVM